MPSVTKTLSAICSTPFIHFRHTPGVPTSENPKRPLGDRRHRQTGRGEAEPLAPPEWRVGSREIHRTPLPHPPSQKGRGLGETIGFPSSFASGERINSNHFRQGVYLPKIPRLSRLGRRSPVRRLVVGALQGGACSPWKAVTRGPPRTSSGTPPGPPRPPWAWRCRWTPAGRPRSCGPSGCQSPRPWRRPPRRRPAPCWG